MQEFKPVKEGKVREVYDNGDSLIIVATDRISAFDHILKNKITKKGAILTQMSKFWSWLGLAIVVFVFVLRLVFKLQNKHAQHMVEKERAKAEKTREEAVKQAREEGRAEAMAAQQAQEAEAVAAEPAADESASPAAEETAPAENADPEKAVEC
mgnify:CR=1 FL=1